MSLTREFVHARGWGINELIDLFNQLEAKNQDTERMLEIVKAKSLEKSADINRLREENSLSSADRDEDMAKAVILGIADIREYLKDIGDLLIDIEQAAIPFKPSLESDVL